MTQQRFHRSHNIEKSVRLNSFPTTSSSSCYKSFEKELIQIDICQNLSSIIHHTVFYLIQSILPDAKIVQSMAKKIRGNVKKLLLSCQISCLLISILDFSFLFLLSWFSRFRNLMRQNDAGACYSSLQTRNIMSVIQFENPRGVTRWTIRKDCAFAWSCWKISAMSISLQRIHKREKSLPAKMTLALCWNETHKNVAITDKTREPAAAPLSQQNLLWSPWNKWQAHEKLCHAAAKI